MPQNIAQNGNAPKKRIAVELARTDWQRLNREIKRRKKAGFLNASISYVVRDLIRTHLN